jgi:hypothetical protein
MQLPAGRRQAPPDEKTLIAGDPGALGVSTHRVTIVMSAPPVDDTGAAR